MTKCGDASTDSPIVSAMFHAVPHSPHQARPTGRASFPQGKLLYRALEWYHSPAQVIFETWRAADCRPYRHTGGWYHSTARVIFAAWLGDESSPLHCVAPFNCTGYSRNVAGGRLLMNECVIAPGNHWFLIRCAEHHPYGHAGGWYRLSARVIIVTLLGDESSPLHWVYRISGSPFFSCGAATTLPGIHRP